MWTMWHVMCEMTCQTNSHPILSRPLRIPVHLHFRPHVEPSQWFLKPITQPFIPRTWNKDAPETNIYQTEGHAHLFWFFIGTIMINMHKPCFFPHTPNPFLATLLGKWWSLHPFYFRLPSGKLTQLLNITIFNGKIHYKWWFSIAMLNNQRVQPVYFRLPHFKRSHRFHDGSLVLWMMDSPMAWCCSKPGLVNVG